jgi:single-strand DNA-binding protein
MNDIGITVMGNLVNDVELRFTASGEAVASFRIASTTRRFDRAGDRWIDGDTHYFTVSCWRNLAHNTASSLIKGMPVIVTGRMRSREHAKEVGDQTVTMRYVDIEAISVGPDLSKGTCTFNRVKRDSVVESERRMLADVLGQDAAEFLTDPDSIMESVDLETGEVVTVNG